MVKCEVPRWAGSLGARLSSYFGPQSSLQPRTSCQPLQRGFHDDNVTSAVSSLMMHCPWRVAWGRRGLGRVSDGGQDNGRSQGRWRNARTASQLCSCRLMTWAARGRRPKSLVDIVVVAQAKKMKQGTYPSRLAVSVAKEGEVETGSPTSPLCSFTHHA